MEQTADILAERRRHYRRRSRIARWTARTMILALGLLLIAAFSAEPRLAKRLTEAAAAWAGSEAIAPARLSNRSISVTGGSGQLEQGSGVKINRGSQVSR